MRLSAAQAILIVFLAATLAPCVGERPARAGRGLPPGVKVSRDIEYARAGERALLLDLYLPEKAEGPLPIIVWIHGGAFRAGSKENCPAARFVPRGFAAASISYRFSQEAIFPAQIEDAKAAVRWLRANASKHGLDPERVGAWGASAGGHLAALLGTSGDVKELEGKEGHLDRSSRVQAVCDFFGPTDFLSMNATPGLMDHDAADSPESQLIGGPIQENKEKAARANPVTYVSKDDPPFLIVHGDRDPLVPIGQSELLDAALRKAGVDATLHVVKGGGHGGFEGPELDEMVLAFFSKHLKGPRGAPQAATGQDAARFTGPWDMEALRRPPRVSWGERKGLLREVWYEGEPSGGKSTRVFAWYGRPEQGAGPFPAMLLVHGGGGRAFAEWASLWAARGYVALAMDTAGQGPDGKRLPDGGPDQGDECKFRPPGPADINETWTYHAVAAVVRGHSLLAAQGDVDASRIGITGISWGGYLTCIVTGIDDRLKVSVPVYGCGFIHENSCWLDWFAKLPEDARTRWISNLDPSRYLAGVRCPVLFVNGTNDFAYPLDSYQKSYRLVPGRTDLSIRVRMPHGHAEGWNPVEIGLFADSVLKGADPLPSIGEMVLSEGRATAGFTSKTRVVKGQLHHAVAEGPWQKREWHSVDAALSDGTVSAELPKERPLVYYMSISDERDALVSTPHAILSAP